ncbi:MAG: hypothetical protein HC923_10765 [Myxococcales bacterium]|nr:hypothetical protein [Myxococcales bacterium]
MAEQYALRIASSWDGAPLDSEEHAFVGLSFLDGLTVTIDAPFHSDPPPPRAPGRTPGLWQYEAVELFVASRSGSYLEVEVGPHGHYWLLRFRGTRDLERDDFELENLETRGSGKRWQAKLHIPSAWLPIDIAIANAYSVHGPGIARRYEACHPVPGPAPDFHQLGFFRPLRADGDPVNFSCG